MRQGEDKSQGAGCAGENRRSVPEIFPSRVASSCFEVGRGLSPSVNVDQDSEEVDKEAEF